MLGIALQLDYGDELGRRKMFDFLRSVMRSHTVTDTHLEKVVKLLRMISIDEKDFTRYT
jgi:condensin complex subunit 3